MELKDGKLRIKNKSGWGTFINGEASPNGRWSEPL